MGRLTLRRSRDGELRVTGDVPDDHYFSAQWIADRLAAGEVEVTVTLNTADTDPITWDLVGLEGEDGDRNTVSWHVRKDAN
jgi:hypothetical protein